jgi:hypothetical protein
LMRPVAVYRRFAELASSVDHGSPSRTGLVATRAHAGPANRAFPEHVGNILGV